MRNRLSGRELLETAIMARRAQCPQGAFWWTDMLWVVLLLGASGLAGGYAAERAVIPKLQYRPGTPNEVVETCRQAAIAAARTHADEMGAELIRVDATSAGEMRRTRGGQRAPVEIGIVYSRSGGREARQGVVDCRVDTRGKAAIADLAGAAR
jgi:hypothetical protein